MSKLFELLILKKKLMGSCNLLDLNSSIITSFCHFVVLILKLLQTFPVKFRIQKSSPLPLSTFHFLPEKKKICLHPCLEYYKLCSVNSHPSQKKNETKSTFLCQKKKCLLFEKKLYFVSKVLHCLANLKCVLHKYVQICSFHFLLGI